MNNQALVDALLKFQRWVEAGGPDHEAALSAAEEPYTAPDGTVWQRPTAEAYYLACQALKKRGEELREEQALRRQAVEAHAKLEADWRAEKERADEAEGHVHFCPECKMYCKECACVETKLTAAEARAEALEKERDEARKGEAKAWSDYNRKSDEQAYDFAKWFKMLNFNGLTEYQPECCIYIDAAIRELVAYRWMVEMRLTVEENAIVGQPKWSVLDVDGHVLGRADYPTEAIEAARAAMLATAKEVGDGK